MSKAKFNGKEYDLSKGKDRNQYWTDYAADKLVGKIITKVEYLSSKEAKDIYWYKRPLAMQLNDGIWIYPMQDDEGNDGGAIAYGEKDTFPVLGVEDE